MVCEVSRVQMSLAEQEQHNWVCAAATMVRTDCYLPEPILLLRWRHRGS